MNTLTREQMLTSFLDLIKKELSFYDSISINEAPKTAFIVYEFSFCAFENFYEDKDEKYC